MSEDIIEKTIGRFGKYQCGIVILVMVGSFPAQFQMYNVVFILPSVDYVCLDGNINITNHCPCEGPLYDDSVIKTSATSEWNLICDRTVLASLAQSMMHVGMLPGTLLFGHISDRYGRKLAVNLSFLTMSIFVSLSAILPNLWVFMIFHFLIGISVGGNTLCCYVIFVEFCGTSFRNYMVLINGIADFLGYFLLPVIAYYLRDWRYLQLACGAPWLYVIVYFWIIPESPRWLITVGRRKEAIELLTNIAKRNRLATDNIEEIVNEAENKTKTDEEVLQHGSYKDLFKTPKIRLYSIVNALMWMLCAYMLFGITQYIGTLPGNLYINVMVSSLCILPGIALILISIIYLRRRTSVPLSFLIAAVPYLLFLVVPNTQWVRLPLSLIGVTGIYSVSVQMYLYSSEIFPTMIRSSALGFFSMSARIGSFIAPFVINIGIEWVTLVVFSGSGFLAALLCYFLPETKGIVLLNTVEQLENSNRRSIVAHVSEEHDLETQKLCRRYQEVN